MACFYEEITRNATDSGWDKRRFGPFNTVQEAGEDFYGRCLGLQSPNDPANCKHDDGRLYTVGEVLCSFRQDLIEAGYLDLEDGSWIILPLANL